MRKTENKRNKIQMPAGIRQKMMAATSMLLVAAIMLVSSTYAWFTLSTAPEVAGITTNVGSNGNLEMLLLNGKLDAGAETESGTGSYYNTADDLGVESGENQSMVNREVTEANEYWGNLVDLGETSYGLNDIKLSPARLAIAADGTIDQVTMLKAPNYGSDGRVIDVDNSTYTGKYDDANNRFMFDEYHRGVRAIGTTTTISQRLALYNAAKANTGKDGIYTSLARNTAQQSLINNGQSLANIVIKKALEDAPTFTNEDMAPLQSILTALDTANGNIELSIKNAVIAHNLSEANTASLTDAEATALRDTILNTTLSESLGESVLLPTGYAQTYAKYQETEDDISMALNTYEEIYQENGSYSWEQISSIVDGLLNREYITVFGIRGNELDMSKASEILAAITGGNSEIVMSSGAGVYVDIAELTGDYVAPDIDITVNATLAGTAINQTVPVTMRTQIENTGDSGNSLPYLANITLGSKPEESGQAENAVLSDTYGYALDFGFRTNAPVSNLLLQTAAANRVYSDDKTAANVQGLGSYMQFTSTDPSNFTAQDVLNLMSAIRVAFVDVKSGELIAIGALDITRDMVDGKWACKIDTTAAGTVNEAIESNDTVVGYKAGLFLYSYNKTDNGIELVDKKSDKSAIATMGQNVASKITTIVYLDGDIVDNSMVANSDTSVTGHMNLQFSSSATLTPMENTGLREGGASIDYGSAVATANQEYTINGMTGTVNSGYSIYRASNGSFYYKEVNSETYVKIDATNINNVITVASP